MDTVALVLGIVGAVLTFVSAGWLAFGFSPTNPRYVEESAELYLGPQRSTVVPNLLADQRKVIALSFAGAGAQLLGLLLGLIA